MRACIQFLILFCAVLLATACGVKSAYNNADWLLMRWINDRVDLTTQQERAVRTSFEQHLQWHCASELPAYAEFLRRLNAEVADGRVTAEVLEAHAERVWEFGQRLLTKMRPALIDLLASLNEQQVDQLLESFEERNRELAEEVERSETALQRERVRGMEKSMRRFTGRLTRDQRERLEAWAAELEPTASLVLEQRLDWQERFAQVLSMRHDRHAFEAAMSRLLRPDSSDSGSLETRRNANRERTLQALVDLHRMAPDQQHDRVQDRLDGLAGELQQLSCG